MAARKKNKAEEDLPVPGVDEDAALLVGVLGDDVYGELSNKQRDAILSLLEFPTVAQAADATGISRSTLFIWLAQETFKKAYRRARRDSFTQAISLTQRYAPVAVNVLAEVMMDKSSAAQSRVSAASNILKFSRDALQLDDLEQRIASLEEAARETIAGSGRRVA